MPYLLAIVFIVWSSASDARPQCGGSDSLTVRNAHAMAYDSKRGRVLLFGGADERSVLSDLWTWDGSVWRCLASGGPAPRTFPGLVYDGANDQLVLFGGNRVLFGSAEDTATFLADTWIWDGLSWKEVHTPSPPARAEAALAYDVERERVVLFGGYSDNGDERVRFGDTWEWDGQSWQQKQVAGPPPRNGAAITYDSYRKCVVLFGGSGGAGDTWEWDGRTWTHIATADTTARFNPAMTYDAAREKVIRFGGWAGDNRVGGTWIYDSVSWRKVTNDGPAARNHSAMTFDTKRGLVVLFGGHDGDRVFGDTWEWDGISWKERRNPAPRLRISNGH